MLNFVNVALFKLLKCQFQVFDPLSMLFTLQALQMMVSLLNLSPLIFSLNIQTFCFGLSSCFNHIVYF